MQEHDGPAVRVLLVLKLVSGAGARADVPQPSGTGSRGACWGSARGAPGKHFGRADRVTP
jgi:hypothetical protein